MNRTCGDLFTTMHQFGKLKIGDLFPDISKTDCMTLTAIHHFSTEKQGMMTVSELAEKIHAQSSAVSRSLKTLEDRNLIERTINKQDRRNTYVALTNEGEKEIKQIQEIMDDFANAVISRMDEADMQKMITYLNELFQIAQEEIEVRSKKKGKDK